MFEMQIKLANFCARAAFQQQSQTEVITLRFGPIKINIQLVLINDGTMVASKKVLLQLSKSQLELMFQTMAFGMFIQNSRGNSFAILSLQALKTVDQIVDHQVNFMLDQMMDQVSFSGELSLKFQEFKEPRMPKNTDKIQNHKTFGEFFQKPAIPSQNRNVQAKTLTNFVQKNAANYGLTGVGSNFSKTGKNGSKKKALSSVKKVSPKKQLQIKQQQRIQMIRTQFLLNKEDKSDDGNPPVIDFVNKENSNKGKTLSKAMFEINNTAPEHLKLAEIYQESKKTADNYPGYKSGFREKKQEINNQQGHYNFSKNKDNGLKKLSVHEEENVIQTVKINREQLKLKAKRQLETYQGNKCVQIPIFKNGKYQLANLNDLTEEEVANYALIQKQRQEEDRQKQQLSKKLKQQAQQNEKLRLKLEEREFQIARQQEQAKRLAMQAIINQRNLSHQVKQRHYSRIEEEVEEDYPNKIESQNGMDSSQDYSSDFESASLGNSELKSRISPKKRVSESESYNESYDPDFESYSQSLLGGSQKKISLSDISDSYKSISPKKY